MPKPFAFENNFHGYFVPTIASADLSEVTESEIGAGVPLTPSLLGDGVNFNWTNNNTATNMLDGWQKSSVGSRGLTIELTMLLDQENSDEVYDNFDEHGLVGYFVACRRGEAAVGEVVEIYPGTFGKRQGAGPSVDTDQTFSVQMAVGEEPADSADVVAGT